MEKLTTERLILRRFKPSDEDEFVEILTHPSVYKFLGDGKGITIERSKIAMLNYMFSRGIFAVCEKESGDLIGYSGVRPLPNGEIELLYGFIPNAWGKGFATEAGIAVLEYAKENFDIETLIAIAYPKNLGSNGVIKKLGFEYQGQEEYFGNMLEKYTLNLSKWSIKKDEN